MALDRERNQLRPEGKLVTVLPADRHWCLFYARLDEHGNPTAWKTDYEPIIGWAAYDSGDVAPLINIPAFGGAMRPIDAPGKVWKVSWVPVIPDDEGTPKG